MNHQSYSVHLLLMRGI